MTRSKLRRSLRRVYVVLGAILITALATKLADHIPVLKGTLWATIAKDFYELIRDTSLLLATGGVAYISNAFQQRSSFVDALKTEWHDIVTAKSALLIYIHKATPTPAEYVAAHTRLSETIDNMRVVYRNVGETTGYIGLYPFAPLHDMRRVLQSLDPKHGPTTIEQRDAAREAMLAVFYPLRDEFLDELDLGPPDNSLLQAGARRIKVRGSLKWAQRLQGIQRTRQDRVRSRMDATDELLGTLYAAERAKEEAGQDAGAGARTGSTPAKL